jgi:hypothetical protein
MPGLISSLKGAYHTQR